METKKCDYCGKDCDTSLFGTLDNGSEACVICIKEENLRISEREQEIKESKEKKK